MAVSIRLRREGSKNRPYYRVVVADSRGPRDGKFIEILGTYDPKLTGQNSSFSVERAEYWMSKGARPSDTVRSLITPTPAGDWTSVAVHSDGSYGIEKGLIASMPIRTNDGKTWEVVQGVPVDAFSQGKIDASINELKEERDAVKDLLPK